MRLSAFIASLAFHGLVGLAASVIELPKRASSSGRVALSVVEKRPQALEADPRPSEAERTAPPLEAERPPPRGRPRPEPRPEGEPRRPRPKAPGGTPAARDAPPPDLAPARPEPGTPPRPRAFSVNMESTVVAGDGVAVPATAGSGDMAAPLGDAPSPGRRPVGEGAQRAGGPSGEASSASGNGAAAGVTRLPEFLGSERDRTPPYPEAARARGVEGQVLLKVFVNADGRVARVRVVRPLDPSCDAVAVEWARERFRFRPALAGDRPVGVWIDVPITFVIER